jgi:hypothetical protein
MPDLIVSAPFRNYLEDYAKRIGKSPAIIVEEAVSQAIGRHLAPDKPGPEDTRILAPAGLVPRIVAAVPGVGSPTPVDTTLGEFFEHLPDQNWTYQICQAEDHWFLVVGKAALELPEWVEKKYVEHNQASCWTYGYAKAVRLWSGTDRFLVVF